MPLFDCGCGAGFAVNEHGERVCADCGSLLRAAFPHCDSRVLHLPGKCVYCDEYPEKQDERNRMRVNFTGDNHPGFSPCPAESRRPLASIEAWGGNVAMTEELMKEREREWDRMLQTVRGQMETRHCRLVMGSSCEGLTSFRGTSLVCDKCGETVGGI